MVPAVLTARSPRSLGQATGMAPLRLLAVLAGGIAAGYGALSLGLVLALPPPSIPGLPDPAPSAASQVAPSDWPDLFGRPSGAALREAPAETALPALPEMQLRGLALDEEGGWALIEFEGRLQRLRPGDPATAGFRLEAVGPDNARLSDGLREIRLEFESVTGLGPLAPATARTPDAQISDADPRLDDYPQPDAEPMAEGAVNAPTGTFQGRP